MIGTRQWIVLLLILFALGAWIGFQSQNEQGVSESFGELTGLVAEQVTTIRLLSGNQAEIVIERDADGDWSIVGPVHLKADQGRVATLLKFLALVPVSRYPIDNVERDELGLSQPSARIVLNGGEILFGGQEQIGGARYVAMDDELFLLYDDDSIGLIQAGLTGLVDQRLLAMPDRVTAIELPTLRLTRTGTGWTSDPPYHDPDSIGNAWLTARARWVEIATTEQEKGIPVRIQLANGGVLQFETIEESGVQGFYRPGLKLRYFLDKADYRAMLAATR